MKKPFSLILLMGILFEMSIVSGFSQEAVKEGEFVVNTESYTLTEVLSLKWGEGDNEIGLGEEDGYKWGPQAIFVDRNENIYISDTANMVIKKYNSAGKLEKTIKDYSGGTAIYVDKEDNIFAERVAIVIFDKNGDIKNKINPPSQRMDSIHRIRVSGQGDINLVTLEKAPAKFYRLRKVDGEDEYGFSESTITLIGEGFPSFYKDDKVITIAQMGKLPADIVIKTFFLQDDGLNNLYFLDNKTIYKYDEKGNLLAKGMIFLDSVASDPCLENIFITKKGDIYQLYTIKEGIRIVKWKL